jgi:enolase-phosphatase E1
MPRYILTDIEGTTTSITFVHDVLFPYAKAHLREWVERHADEARVAELLAGMKAHAWRAQGVDWTDADCIHQLLAWIDEDRKEPALKTLQGWIWADGYHSGAYTSHIYPDVQPALARWQAAGMTLGVYSSGSVEAQDLLFGHTVDGDLRHYFSHYFDTQVGHKRDAAAYRNIQQAIGIPAEEILFLSDIPEELDAASAAGMQVCHLLRPGTQAVERYVGVPDFSMIAG